MVSSASEAVDSAAEDAVSVVAVDAAALLEDAPPHAASERVMAVAMVSATSFFMCCVLPSILWFCGHRFLAGDLMLWIVLFFHENVKRLKQNFR